MAKILIVDDEPRIRDLIRAHLEHEGFSCEEAGDGGAALSALSNGDVDLVILDIMMPFVDGMTCLKEMRSRKINTPVIMLTAREDIWEDSVRVQFTGFGDSSLNILVQYYAKTGALADFLKIQEEVNLDLMGLMEQAGCEFAFPSVSIYREK